MKFYYNNKLMRTSKNHVYTHAVIDGENCVACSSTFEGAKKVVYSELSRCERGIQSYQNMKDALEKGATGFWDVLERKKMWVKIDKSYKYHTVESANSNIKYYKDRIDYVNAHWMVVELEAR